MIIRLYESFTSFHICAKKHSIRCYRNQSLVTLLMRVMQVSSG